MVLALFKIVIAFVIACINLSFAIDISGCGSTKACVFSTDGCISTNADCLIFTYTWNQAQNNFDMEISGGSGDGSQYVAVAFSPNGNMERSDLYYCTGSSFRSGTIQAQYSTPVSDASLPSGISNVTTANNAGITECSFTRAASISKSTSSVVTTVFDLSFAQFHILQAVGPFTTTIQRHSGRYTSGPYNFTTGELVTMTTPTPSPTTTPSGGGSNAADGCGTTKGCFQSPASCVPGAGGCRFASWVYDTSANEFNIEIIGGTGDQYAAIAFGDSNLMVDADLYYCTANGLQSGAIQARQQRPDVTPSLPAELTNVVNSVTNGAVTCSFTRPAGLSKTISNGRTVDFNLSQRNYFLLYAVGGVAAGAISYHGPNGRTQSGEALNFTQVTSSGGTGSGNRLDLIKGHACLMLVAWLTCASIGVIIARHFKPLWHDNTCVGQKVWFQLHRSLMILVLLCTVTAFALIFVANEGNYSSNAGAHPIIGIIVTCLVIINPVMALFRPHPGTPNRKIFNWAHWFVGSWARILGIVAIFLGVDLTVLNLPEWDTWVLVGFVAFHVITEIVLELLSASYEHIAVYKKLVPQKDIAMENEPPVADAPPRGALIKYMILLVYSLGNIAFLITFIVTIAGHQ